MNRDKQPVSACNMSVAQQEYVAREIRRHRQVTICRVMLLVLLLALWELAADMHWIDSFIFSSPTMIAKCLVTMTRDGSLFLHTGVTLLETLISFALCTVFGLACALLLWSSKSVAQVLEPFLVLLNSLPVFLSPLFQSTDGRAWITSRLNKAIPAAWAATAARQENKRCSNAASVTRNTLTEKRVRKKLDFPVRYRLPWRWNSDSYTSAYPSITLYMTSRMRIMHLSAG